MKMTKWIRYIGTMVICVWLMTSCRQEKQGELEEEVVTESIELQSDEVAILTEMYIDAERIEEGRLLPYQQDTLKRYRYAREYLALKYSGLQVTVLHGEPKSKYTTQAEFTFSVEDDDDTYEVYVSGDEVYEAKDNYYAAFFAEKYDNFLLEQLKKSVDNVVYVHSSMPWAKGMEYGYDMTMDDIVSGKLELSVNSYICIADSAMTKTDLESVKETIEGIIKKLCLYGTFKIYVYEDGYSQEQTTSSRLNTLIQNF